MPYLSRSKTSERKQQKDAEQISSEGVHRPIPTDPTHGILGLQHTAGNQAVTRLLQQNQHSPDPVDGVPPIVYTVLNSPGQPLDSGTRAFMEPRFGYDFSQVRAHTDAQAAESAQTVNALAYTVGRDIVFGTGQYAPETAAGSRLLAHELTHTIQQMTGLGKSVPLSMHPIADSAEQEADNLADTITPIAKRPVSNAHGYLPKVGLSVQPAVQRQPISSPSPQAESAVNNAQTEKDLDADFHSIVRKLDVLFYSDKDEKEVFAILNKWAAVPNPPHSSSRPGSRYLEQLLMKLQRKNKDVGIISEQRVNYYSQLFSRSSRLNELRALRDTHAPLYAGDEGVGETSFGGVLWENVEKGVVRDQIFAYGKGLGKGIYEGGKGFVKGVLHPVETAKGIYQSVKHFDETKANIKKLAKRYIDTASEDPVKFAEMTGELAGQVEVALVTPKVVAKGGGLVAAGATRLASTAQRWGRIGLTGAMLGVGQVVPKIGAGSAFVRSAATMSTTARVVEASEQITAKAAALPKIQAATQIAQEATQVADDVAEVAQEATQATQSGASAVSTASTTSTTTPTLASTAGTVSPSAAGALGSPSLTGSVLTAVAQTAGQVAGAQQTYLNPAQYQQALGHVLPSQYFDPVMQVIEQIGQSAAQAAVANPAFVNACRSGNWTLAGTLFHSAAARVGPAFANQLPPGFSMTFEDTIQTGKGGSRFDTRVVGPGVDHEVDWKTTGRSALSTGSRSEMARHGAQYSTNVGRSLTGQESKSWVDFVRPLLPGINWPK